MIVNQHYHQDLDQHLYASTFRPHHVLYLHYNCHHDPRVCKKVVIWKEVNLHPWLWRNIEGHVLFFKK